MDPFLGRTFGQFVIEESLAQGGQGTVYVARHRHLGVRRALKLLLPDLAHDHAFIERFRREAKTAAEIHHPNVVEVFDFGEENGVFYLVMEYAEGRPLRSILDETPILPLDRVLYILTQLASAIDTIHAHRIIHRDIKPSNIMVRGRDSITLVDFGIAIDPSGSRVTQTGMVVGTPEYLAPELIVGGAPGPSGDLYSAAVIAYEMLAGSIPFSNLALHELMLAQVRESPPPLSSRRSGLPTAVDAVLSRALAKQPGDRYPSAVEFVSALRGALGPIAVPRPVAPPIDRTLRRSPRQQDIPEAITAADAARRQADVPTGQLAALDGAPASGRSSWRVLHHEHGHQFLRPTGVAVHWSDTIVVCDSGHRVVVRLRPTGEVAGIIGGDGPVQLESPAGIAVDTAGQLYVADPGAGAIRRFSRGGQIIDVIGPDIAGLPSTFAPQACAIDSSGHLFVADWTADRVVIMSAGGDLLGHWATAPYPAGVAVGPDGTVLVASWGADAVLRYTMEGTLLDTIGARGRAPGELWNPSGLAVDLAGNLYIADTNNHRVQLLGAHGQPLASWGRHGSAPGEFKFPFGIALDAHGAIIVTDTANHRLQVLGT